jgi:ADP-heptose:LPS heptosyltransferase
MVSGRPYYDAEEKVRRMEANRFRRGLLVQLAGLGDLVMALPAIDALLDHYPDTDWTLLTRPAQARLLEGRNIHVVTMPWPPKVLCFRQQFSTVWQLRRCRFDLVLHLYSAGSKKGEWAIRTLFKGIHAGLSIGRVNEGQALFDINWDESQLASRHEVDLNLWLLSALDITPPYAVPVVNVSGEVSARVGQHLASVFSNAVPLAVIFAGGARRTRHWSIGNYMQIIHYLRSLNMGVCIVGGSQQTVDAMQMSADDPLVINFTERLELPELAALMQKSKIYIGNDSGPSHLAAAAGLPSVVLFGPGDADRYCPRGEKSVRVARFEVDCSPCYLEQCSHHTCMRSLSVDMVKAEIDATLSGLTVQ